ncbi:MAG: site-specific integrase [Fermentimonas sp.]|nr:site-specific integrase [Fermentimonas sp.]
MEKATFSVSYFLRLNKLYRNGEAPLLVRITYNGQRTEFTSNHRVKPEFWDQKSNKALGKTVYAKKVNGFLDHIYLSLCDSIKDLEERGMEVTAENIKNNHLGFIEFKQVTLLSLYSEHNQKMEALIGKGYSFSTLQKHLTTVEHLKDFLKKNYNSDDILVDKINNQFLLDFEFYLKSNKSISSNTTIKYLKNLGKVIRSALNAGYIKRNPFTGIKYHTEEVERTFLDRSELQLLIDKKIPNKRLEQIRDVFLFCCFTGLAFADVQALTADSLYVPNENEIWIKKRRQKTKKWFHLPLLPQAKNILDRYSNHKIREKGLLLPVPTNQKMNAYLKEIADLCGIKKNLTTHCARHTFATTVTLANGVSMESVSKMLGHSSLLMTKQYAKILDETIGREMQQLKDKLH